MKPWVIVRAAAHGALAWSTYGVVEAAYYFLDPRFLDPAETVLTWWHLRYSAILCGFYFAVGAAAGIAAWLLLRLASRLPRRGYAAPEQALAAACGTLSLALAMAINYFPWPYRKLLALLFGMNLLIVIVTLIAPCSRNVYAIRLPGTGPWTVSCAAIGIPWLVQRLGRDSTTELIGAVAFVIGVSVVGLGCRWLLRIVPGGLRWGPLTRQAAGILAGVGFAAVLAGFAGRGLEVRPRPPVSGIAGGESPDIVLITLDTVRADHTTIGGYQRDTTPNLRRLSDTATLFTRAVAVSNMTLPTHASLFTGLYPRQHGANFDPPDHPAGRPLEDSFTTVAEILSGNGYVTAAVAANHLYIREKMGLAQGFGTFDCRHLDGSYPLPADRLLHRFWKSKLAEFPAAESQRSFLRAAEINERAGRILDSITESTAPFFLFLNYMDAHNPYLPPAPFDTLYPGKDSLFTSKRHDRLLTEVMNRRRKPTSAESQALISQYDGAIAYVDAQIGELVDKLKSIGRFDNTLLIVTSDHGEAFGGHYTIRHAFQVYQNEIAIPLVVKFPGQSRGETRDFLVSQVDIAAAILDAAGIGDLEWMDGRLPGNAPRRGDFVISQSFPNPLAPYLDERFQAGQLALLSGARKFIRSSAGKRELYDLQSDPDERHDIAPLEPAVSSALEDELNDWLESTPPRIEGEQLRPDPAVLRRLRSLGYIQ